MAEGKHNSKKEKSKQKKHQGIIPRSALVKGSAQIGRGLDGKVGDPKQGRQSIREVHALID